jgi:hypothetical protein
MEANVIILGLDNEKGKSCEVSEESEYAAESMRTGNWTEQIGHRSQYVDAESMAGFPLILLAFGLFYGSGTT